MQPFKEIDDSYKIEDPWGYQTNPCDKIRKEKILGVLSLLGPFSRALDIGCGEGWITKDLPANVIHGYEVSGNAACRLPENVTRVNQPEGLYDLVVATGVLYSHYDWQEFFRLIEEHASAIVVTCNIKAWERPEANSIRGMKVLDTDFPYREFTQRLRVFDRRS